MLLIRLYPNYLQLILLDIVDKIFKSRKKKKKTNKHNISLIEFFFCRHFISLMMMFLFFVFIFNNIYIYTYVFREEKEEKISRCFTKINFWFGFLLFVELVWFWNANDETWVKSVRERERNLLSYCNQFPLRRASKRSQWLSLLEIVFSSSEIGCSYSLAFDERFSFSMMFW